MIDGAPSGAMNTTTSATASLLINDMSRRCRGRDHHAWPGSLAAASRARWTQHIGTIA
jgi:hypothetical protein